MSCTMIKDVLTLALLHWVCPAFTNSVDQDQFLKKPTDLDLHYLSLSM